jgi:hypothetical protein
MACKREDINSTEIERGALTRFSDKNRLNNAIWIEYPKRVGGVQTLKTTVERFGITNLVP